MTVKFLNNYGTNLAANITSVATTLTVSSGTGQAFLGLLTGGDVYYMTLIQVGSQGPFEIIQVTAVTGDTLTVVRGQDGTTARAWNLGDALENRIPRVVLNLLAQTGGGALGTMATQNASAVAITGGTISGVAITSSTIPNSNVTGLGTAALANTTAFAAAGAATASGLTMSTARLLGRTTASTGAIEEISVGTGLVLSAGTLTATSGTLSNSSASLLADVPLNVINTYFDGPTVNVGTTGTWFVTSTVTTNGDAGDSTQFKLSDGTTIIASTANDGISVAIGTSTTLSGIITNPVAALRMSARSTNSTTEKFVFNVTGNSKDCTITAIRIG